MFEFKNFGQVFEAIDKWQVDVAGMAETYCRGVSVAIFRQAVANSVQYSGDFAANWKYNLNAIDTGFTKGVLQGLLQSSSMTWKHGEKDFLSKFKAHDETGNTWQAQEIAIRNARGKDDAFKLGDIIYISNSAVHDEPYAIGIEKGTIHLRSQESARPLGRAVEQVLRWASDNPLPMNNQYPVTSLAGYKSVTKVTQLDSLRRRFKKHA